MWVLLYGVRGLDAVLRGPGGWARWSAALGCVGISLFLVGSSLWGLEGRIDAVELDSSWSRAAAAVDASGDTVLILPWDQYFDLPAAQGRRVHNPLPFLFTGDIISAHDLELQQDVLETRDRRERLLSPVLGSDTTTGTRGDEALAAALERTGVRWIAVIQVEGVRSARDATPTLEAAERSVGLRRLDEVSTPKDDAEVALYEVETWQPGTTVSIQKAVPFLGRIDDSGVRGPWRRHGLPGWFQGFATASVNDDGTLHLPDNGARWVWYAPGAALAVAHAIWMLVNIENIAALHLRATRLHCYCLATLRRKGTTNK